MQRHTRSRLALTTRSLAIDNRGCNIQEKASRLIRTREFELSSDNKFVLGSLNSRASWFSSDSQLQCKILACASHERVCQFTCECHNFSPCEKSKSCLRPEVFSYLVYSQSTVLFLENSLKNPPDSFHVNERGHAYHQFHISFETYGRVPNEKIYHRQIISLPLHNVYLTTLIPEP